VALGTFGHPFGAGSIDGIDKLFILPFGLKKMPAFVTFIVFHKYKGSPFLQKTFWSRRHSVKKYIIFTASKYLLMLRKYYLLLLFTTVFHCAGYTQSYWVFFTDKKDCRFDPYTYFDAKAIERRIINEVNLYDSTDFPVNASYVTEVSKIADNCNKSRPCHLSGRSRP
jgi:hypothetical protein